MMKAESMLEKFELSAKMDESYEWQKWIEKIPYLKFPPEWEVKVVPPFAGAVVRFFIRREDSPKDERISVYLDCYDQLGFYGRPYWEAYPIDGDIFRCEMEDAHELISAIAQGLDRLNEGK